MKGRLNTKGLKMSLGRFIADRRKCLHMTQEELAEKINVSKSAIAKWELGKTEPTASAIITLAKFFNETTDYILGLEDGKRPKKSVFFYP